MQKNIQLLLLLLTFGFSNQWINIESDVPTSPQISLISSDVETSTLSFDLSGFYLNSTLINNLEYSIVKLPSTMNFISW